MHICRKGVIALLRDYVKTLLCGQGKIDEPARSLLDGTTQSCGCLARELKAVEKTKHGKSKSKEYSLLHSAKYRANKTGVDFNLELSDIRIPESCPLLGIKIESGTSMLPSSPTVDKIDPARGYVKGNIWVISQKANRMKSNLTVNQMRHFASTIELISSSLPHSNDDAEERRPQQ